MWLADTVRELLLLLTGLCADRRLPRTHRLRHKMRRIRARKQRRLRQPLRLHQHIDHAARILQLDERRHRQVELALGPSGFGHVA